MASTYTSSTTTAKTPVLARARTCRISGRASSRGRARSRRNSMIPPSPMRWATCSEVHEMPDFLTPGLIAIIVGVLVVVLVIAVSPKSLADAIGQIFQLLGRFVGALAGE